MPQPDAKKGRQIAVLDAVVIRRVGDDGVNAVRFHRQASRGALPQEKAVRIIAQQSRRTNLFSTVDLAVDRPQLWLTIIQNTLDGRGRPAPAAGNAAVIELLQRARRSSGVDRVVLQGGIGKRVTMMGKGVAHRPGPALVAALVAAEHRVELKRGRNKQRQIEAHDRIIFGQQAGRFVQKGQLAAREQVEIAMDVAPQ